MSKELSKQIPVEAIALDDAGRVVITDSQLLDFVSGGLASAPSLSGTKTNCCYNFSCTCPKQ